MVYGTESDRDTFSKAQLKKTWINWDNNEALDEGIREGALALLSAWTHVAARLVRIPPLGPPISDSSA